MYGIAEASVESFSGMCIKLAERARGIYIIERRSSFPPSKVDWVFGFVLHNQSGDIQSYVSGRMGNCIYI